MLVPGSSSSQQHGKSQSQLQKNHHLKLQMQQQYLLNQIPGSNPPSLPLNMQSYQQVLTHNLSKLQKNKLYLSHQLKSLSMGGGGGAGDTSSSPSVHQVNLKLQQTQQHISQINHQLQLLTQLSATQQQSDTSPDSVPGLCSPMVGGHSGGPSNPQRSSGSKQGGPMGGGGRSHSTSGIPEEGGLMYNLQGLSLGHGHGGSSGSNGGTNQSTSVRSVSRLHQIFSGSSSSDSLSGGLTGMDGPGQGSMFSHGGSQGSSPFSPPRGGSSSIAGGMGGFMPDHASFGSSANTGLSVPPAGKPFTDIQEFKPGVPWQPRMQATEPAQLYSKQSSLPGGGSYDNFPSVAQSPAYSNLPSPMLGPGGPQSRAFGNTGLGGSGMGVASTHKYMRSNSTGSGFYGGSGYGNKRLPSPSAKYAHYMPSRGDGGIRQSGPAGMGGGAGGGASSGGGWSSSSSLSSESSLSSGYGGGGNGHVQTRTYYPNRAPAQSPISIGSQFPPGPAMGPGGGGGGMDRSTSWKQQHLQNPQLSNGRRMAPPNSLPPRAAGSGFHASSRSMGSTPLGSRDLFGTNHAPSVPASASDDKWGSMTPGPMTLSPAVLSNVWGTGTLGTPGNTPSQWGKDEVSKLWNQVSESDPVSAALSKPPGLSMNPDPSQLYMKGEPKAFADGGNSFVTTPTLTSENSTWGQEEVGSAEGQKEAISPEPTFAEWQAGKKARLSVFKMPTSPWLVVKNVTTQVRMYFDTLGHWN